MRFKKSFIKKFAWFTIFSGIFYFFGESYFIFLYGQHFLQTLIDIIAVSMLFFGGITSLKNPKKLGILCGAWGVNFCINYRAWVWRYTLAQKEQLNENTDIVGSILLTLLIFSTIAFTITILMNLPKTKIL